MTTIPHPSHSATRQPDDRGILLLNFGGPQSLEEVSEFLYEILSDPNTLQLPFPQALQNRLARSIARRRSPEISRQYGVIGGRSPIVPATERILEALRLDLRARGIEMPIWAIHRYLPGFTDRVVQTVLESRVTHLLALPLYPHFTYTTTGSGLSQVHDTLRRRGWEGELEVVRSYPDAPGYVEALSARLDACLTAARPDPEQTVILCSAHGLPRDYVARGDPYVRELERTMKVLTQRFPHWRFELSFQSRVGPAEWLKPYTDEIIPKLAEEGVRSVVFLPISFVNDHIETIYEIGITYFDLAKSHGIEPHRVPAVEDHPAFIETLADGVAAWNQGARATRWSEDHLILPARDLLPADQSWRRVGRYTAGLWAAATFAALIGALL